MSGFAANLQVSGIRGVIELCVSKPDGETRRFTENTMTNITYGHLFGDNAPTSFASLFNYIAVGSGTTPINAASVGLQSPEGTVSGIVTRTLETFILDTVEYTCYKLVRIFLPGSLDATISEVGIFKDNNNTSLLAGKVIVNELGNPSPVSIGLEDSLTVTYRLLFIEPPTGIVIGAGSVMVGLTSVNYTLVLRSEFDYKTADNYLFNLPIETPAAISNRFFVNDVNLDPGVSTQTCAVSVDSVNKIRQHTISLFISSSAGILNVDKIGVGFGYSSVDLNTSNHRILDIVFENTIVKSDLEALSMDVNFTVDWG